MAVVKRVLLVGKGLSHKSTIFRLVRGNGGRRIQLLGKIVNRSLCCYNILETGAVAQLGERLLCTEEVRGSSPLSSTLKPKIVG